MNGISLFVALAAMGVDVGWEAGPSGRLLYTIRIEQVLVEPLREGQAVVSAVDANDRGLRRFQILMGSGQDAAAARTSEEERSRDGTMVQHGWRVGEHGGVDYLIQVTPERLETLAKGVPIIGEIAPEVSEVRRFYIFAGVRQLPRETPPAATNAANAPPDFLAVGSTNGQPPAGTPPAGTRFESPRGADPGLPLNQPLGTAGRNSRFSDYAEQDGNGGWRTDAAGGAAADRYARPNSNWGPVNNTYPDRPGAGFPSNTGGSYAPPGTGYDRPSYQGYDPRANGGYPDQGQPAPPSQPVASYTQRPVSQPAAQPAAPSEPAAPAAVPATPANVPAGWTAGGNATPGLNWSQPVSTGKMVDDSVRPWTPLILTTLALFASLGANAYLAWLAWSFFWRYRDASNDLARSRTLATAARQAA